MSNVGQVNPFFTPTQFSNCQLWLDAADRTTLTLNGPNVTRWRDKSGKNFVATASGTVTTSSLNGSNVLYMPQTRMEIANFSQNVYSTTFFVANAQTAYLILNFINYETYIFVYNFDLYYFKNGAASIQLRDSVNGSGTPVVPANTYFLFSIGYGGGSTTSVYNVNGTPRNTVVTGGAPMANATLTTTYLINANQANTIKDNTYFCELIIYNSVLSQAEAQRIEGYLAWKWGLQANLPANHPYKSSPIPPFLSPPTTLPLGLPGIWQPIRFSNCQLWLDASKETRTGTITSITDLTSNAYTGSIVSATVQQRYLNKLNVWYFPSYNLQFNAFPWRTRFTLIFLLNTAGFAFTSQRVGGGGSYINYYLSNNCYLFTVNGYGTLYGNEGSAAGSCGPDITPKNQWVIMVFAYNGGTLPSFYRFNGVNRTNINSAGAGASDTTITENIAINGSTASTTNNASNTYYAEHIHYNAGLSLAQIETVEGYLAWKWGLQGNLPANHPFKKWPPAP